MKYNFCVLLIAKDEQYYLEEFLSYYLLLGADHFYIYDNDSVIPVRETLARYQQVCTIYEFPGKAKQYDAYRHFREKHSHESYWVAPIDTDEFIALKQHKDIHAFLKDYAHLDAIGLNWVYFGDSFYEERPGGLVIDNYVRCQHDQNPHIKTLLKSKAWKDCSNVHYLTVRKNNLYQDVKGNLITGPFNEHYTIDIAQINHYFSKSKDECFRKYKRGRADIDENFNLTEEVFHSWRNSLNTCEDTFLRDHFSDPIKKLIASYNHD
jgi:hypothetical protein